MSKVVPISPEAVTEKSGDDMIVTLRGGEPAGDRSQGSQGRNRGSAPTDQADFLSAQKAAEMLSVPPTWLAAKASVYFGCPLRR